MGNDETPDMLAWIFIVLIIGIGLGYAWRYAQEPIQYERGYITGVEELSVVVKEEVCK